MAADYQLALDARAVEGAADVYATLAADMSARLSANETCAVLAPVPTIAAFDNCRFARTCRSCLQKTGCLVHPSGLCSDTNANDYMTLHNYGFADGTQLTSTTRQRWFFPAGTTSYCDASDASCVACRQTPAFTIANDSRFCVGAGGCVCISNCIDETALPTGQVVLVCSSSPLSPAERTVARNGMSVVVQIMAMIVGTLVLVAALLAFRLARMARERRTREAEFAILRSEAQLATHERRNKSAQLGVGELQLAGWRSHREATNGDGHYIEIPDAASGESDRGDGVDDFPVAGIVPRELLPVP